MHYFSLTLIISVGAAACAPASKVKKSTGGSSAAEVDGEVACTGTTGTAPTFKSAIPSNTRTTPIDPNTATFITQFSNGSNETVCQFLTSQNKDVVIYQFAGILCESCKGEAAEFTSSIAASPKGAKMAHAVIFVDSASEMDELDTTKYINDFMLSNTQNKGFARFEPSKLLFKQYNLYDDGVKFGASIAINKFGQQYFINDASQIHELMEQAEKLVP